VKNAPFRAARFSVRKLGVQPSWIGYRWVEPVALSRYAEEIGASSRYQVIHRAARASNELPRNVSSSGDLPADRGWWGYSFRDVPSRMSGETVQVTLTNCRVLPYVDPRNSQFYVCVVTPDERTLDLREMQFRRDRHPAMLRSARPAVRMERATWILERVYHNHSHWLTAHLPKVLLARERGLLSDTILPGEKRTETIDASLRMLGIDEAGPRLDPIVPIEVEELTVLQADRFRPELLESVRSAFAPWISGARERRLYISRARAQRRKLTNENEVWGLAEAAGFERVFMEDHPFEEQVRMMGEAEAVMAPHGAGLTNMIFAPPGTRVIEIADLGFPNPNFYALASAMGHPYWILPAETRGEGHPLERDMWIDPEQVRETLAEL